MFNRKNYRVELIYQKEQRAKIYHLRFYPSEVEKKKSKLNPKEAEETAKIKHKSMKLDTRNRENY